MSGPDNLRQELGALEAALAGPLDPAGREAVKRRLIALLRRTDDAITGLQAFRGELRTLADRYKAAVAAGPTPTPPPPEARTVTRHDRLGASTFVEKGWHLISVGDHAAAKQVLLKALELAPGDLQARALLGWAEMLQEDYDRAMATFGTVLQADPDHTIARVNIGYICLKRRIFGEAIEHLARVIQANTDRKATLYAHYYLGLVYLERGMFADAAGLLERAVQLGPNLIEARCELGRSLWLTGRREEALEVWRAAAQGDLRSPAVARCRELLRLAESGGEVPPSSP
jgi:tetratricopeptide (TPR) repeat protein